MILYGIYYIELNEEIIGKIRKAIVKSKKEIENVKNKSIVSKHINNIERLQNIINNKKNISENDKSILFEIYESIKDCKINELGNELLLILQTFNWS